MSSASGSSKRSRSSDVDDDDADGERRRQTQRPQPYEQVGYGRWQTVRRPDSLPVPGPNREPGQWVPQMRQHTAGDDPWDTSSMGTANSGDDGDDADFDAQLQAQQHAIPQPVVPPKENPWYASPRPMPAPPLQEQRPAQDSRDVHAKLAELEAETARLRKQLEDKREEQVPKEVERNDREERRGRSRDRRGESREQRREGRGNQRGDARDGREQGGDGAVSR